MRGIRTALLFATADKYLTAALSLATTAVVSRFVFPHEFGIAVLGGATIAVAGALRELGSAAYIVQSPELTDDRLRTVFTVNLLITLTVAAALTAGAPGIAALLGQPGIATYLHIATAGYLTGAIVFPLHGLLTREFAFRKLAAINLASAFVNSAVLIALAAAGFSFLSFAAAQAVSALAGMVLLLWVRPQFAIFRPKLTAWRDVLSFSLFSGGSALLHRASEYVALMILGLLLPPAALGLLRRASQISSFPERTILAGVSAVALPAFSEQVRQKGDLAASYVAAVARLTVLIWPGLGLMVLIAHPLIGLLLGPGWAEAAPLVQILAGALLLNFPPGINYPVIIATGATRIAFGLALVQVATALPIVVVAAQFGLYAVAWSMFAIVGIGVAASTVAVRMVVPFAWRGLGREMLRSLGVSLIALAIPLVVVAHAGGTAEMAWSTALALVAATGAAWLAGLRLLAHPAWDDVVRAAHAVARRLFPK
ncbi:MAG: oligosaccharide flippase family protein [Pseudomonadota bacterium]